MENKENVNQLKIILSNFIQNDFPFERSDIFNWANFLDWTDSVLESELLYYKENNCFVDQELILILLKTTQHILYHSFSKSAYNSVERLEELLWVEDWIVLLEVVRTLYALLWRNPSKSVRTTKAHKNIKVASKLCTILLWDCNGTNKNIEFK